MSYAWQYFPGTDTWQPISRMPPGRFIGHAGAVKGKIYLTGGSSMFWPYKPTSTVFEYDPRNDPYLSQKTAGFSDFNKTALKPVWRSASANEADFHIKAEPLIPEKGPSPQAVSCMVQDMRGFIWFGTRYGLLKYDGYTATVYQHDSDNPNSLSDNEVKSMLLDAAGHLWIGTRNGLNRLEPESDQITVYHSEPENPNSLSDNSITAIFEDKSGILWIGTYNGLNRLDPETHKIKRYQWRGGIYAIEEDKAGVLWLGSNFGLYQYERENEQWTHYLPDPQHPDDPNSNFIRSLYADKAGVLWIGTSSGLLHFNRDDPGNIPFIRDIAKNTNHFNYPDNTIWSIHEDRQGIMWFSASHSGLYRYDRKIDDKPKLVNCQLNLPSTNKRMAFLAVLDDNSGTLWISTTRGVCKADNRRLKITSYQADPDNSNSLSNGVITSVLEDDAGILWIGTFDGLNRFDRKEMNGQVSFPRAATPTACPLTIY
jgi:ligand-binding sensor domain-containing protein